VALITTGNSGSNPNDNNIGPSPTSSGPAALAVKISSFTEVQLKPPPGERFAFWGTVTGWTGTDDANAEIFVIAAVPHSGTWLVSPEASVQNSTTWSVSGWSIPNLPSGATWQAIVMNGEGAGPGPTESQEPGGGPCSQIAQCEYTSDLKAAGPDAVAAAAESKPVSLSELRPRSG